MARKVTVKCEIFLPRLTPIEADEIRAQVIELKPSVHLVLADWPYIEARGLTEERAEELIGILTARGVKFRVLNTQAKTNAARVMAAVETFGA